METVIHISVYSIRNQPNNSQQVVDLLSNSLQEVETEQSLCPGFALIKQYFSLGQLPQDKQGTIKTIAESQQYIISDRLIYDLWDQTGRTLTKDVQIRKQEQLVCIYLKPAMLQSQRQIYVQRCVSSQQAKQPSHYGKAP
ncbi:hypothetical protein CHS0354_009179, partial [Potamilus streckersoni]